MPFFVGFHHSFGMKISKSCAWFLLIVSSGNSAVVDVGQRVRRAYFGGWRGGHDGHLLLFVPPFPPKEPPKDQHEHLNGHEDDAAGDQAGLVHALGDEHFFPVVAVMSLFHLQMSAAEHTVVTVVEVSRGGDLPVFVVGLLVALPVSDFVHDVERLNDQDLVRFGRPLGPDHDVEVGPLLPAVGVDRLLLPGEVDDVALDGFAFGHAGRHHGPELDHLRGRESEGVEGAEERLQASPPHFGHDGGIGGTASRVDQQQLGVRGAVDGHQIPHEDLVGTLLLVDDVEDHEERVSDDGRLRVIPVDGVFDPHDDVGTLDGGLLVQRRSDFARDGQVHRVGHGFVGQVVLTGEA